jgi:hypothetical protein
LIFLESVFGDPVPDKVLHVAIFHHFLDQIAEELKDLGLFIVEKYSPKTILKQAYYALKRNLE